MVSTFAGTKHANDCQNLHIVVKNHSYMLADTSLDHYLEALIFPIELDFSQIIDVNELGLRLLCMFAWKKPFHSKIFENKSF